MILWMSEHGRTKCIQGAWTTAKMARFAFLKNYWVPFRRCSLAFHNFIFFRRTQIYNWQVLLRLMGYDRLRNYGMAFSIWQGQKIEDYAKFVFFVSVSLSYQTTLSILKEPTPDSFLLLKFSKCLVYYCNGGSNGSGPYSISRPFFKLFCDG